MIDSNEDIADSVPTVRAARRGLGLYTRLAALEMLMYPCRAESAASQLLGQASASLGARASFTVTTAVAASTCRWCCSCGGPFRIVPVRVTGADDHREALRHGTAEPRPGRGAAHAPRAHADELAAATASSQVLASLATAAYAYTYGVRQADALLNLGNAPAAIAGIS